MIKSCAGLGSAWIVSNLSGIAAAQEHAHHAALSQATPRLEFLTPEQAVEVEAIASQIIPTDDTPGAREAHCAHFIDFVLQASPPPTQTQWRNALSALKEAGFQAADATGRAALVAAMSKPERDRSASHPAFAAYRLIKQQNTFAFYTSRAGMIEALDYKGNSFNKTFPACNHPEHHVV